MKSSTASSRRWETQSLRLSVLRKQVKVVVNLENDEKEIREYKADDLKFKPRKKKQKVSREEMKKLAALEKKDGASKLNDK